MCAGIVEVKDVATRDADISEALNVMRWPTYIDMRKHIENLEREDRIRRRLGW